MKKFIYILISVILVMCMVCGCADSTVKVSKGIKKTEASMPNEIFGGDPVKFITGNDYQKWWEIKLKQLQPSREIKSDIYPFYGSIMGQILSAKEENTVCSPLNIYIALAMVVETADGETQKQILDVLGEESVETLREHANTLWRANFYDTPMIKSQLANSLWLSQDISYHEDVLKNLAEKYYADSFVGNLNSEEMVSAMRNWIDEHTGNLLQEYTKDIKVDPGAGADAVMELISTIFFKGMWITPFAKESTEQKVFHGASKDTDCEMMYQGGPGSYYWGDHFSAVGQSIDSGGCMYFFLPDEGVSPAELVQDPQVMDVIENGFDLDFENVKNIIVNKWIPKFRASSKTDLKESLSQLGITDAFSAEKADFSPLTDDYEKIWICKADHAAMVEIDEEGVTGAAYTDLGYAGAGMPPEEEIDFVLDRPFMFAVTGADGSVLFAGTVYDLE